MRVITKRDLTSMHAGCGYLSTASHPARRSSCSPLNLIPIGDFLIDQLSQRIASILFIVAALAACNGASPDQVMQQARANLDRNDPAAAVVQLTSRLAKSLACGA